MNLILETFKKVDFKNWKMRQFCKKKRKLKKFKKKKKNKKEKL